MGRIKTRLAKAITQELLEKHGEEVSKEFDGNKQLISSRVASPSKKLRNIIAGYATRKKKSETVQ